MNSWATIGRDEIKILVAAKTALPVHDSGRVISRSVGHCGIDGRILKGFGRGPDLYRERIMPTLRPVSL